MYVDGVQGKVTHWGPLQPGETKTYQVEAVVAAATTSLPVGISSNVHEPVYGNNYVNLAVHQG